MLEDAGFHVEVDEDFFDDFGNEDAPVVPAIKDAWFWFDEAGDAEYGWLQRDEPVGANAPVPLLGPVTAEFEFLFWDEVGDAEHFQLLKDDIVGANAPVALPALAQRDVEQHWWDEFGDGDYEQAFRYDVVGPDASGPIIPPPDPGPGGGIGPGTPPTPGFGIGTGTPGTPGFGTGIGAANPEDFGLSGEALGGPNTEFNLFIQFEVHSTPLGDRKVTVIDIIDAGDLLDVTRGVGDHSNVITIKSKRTFSYYTSILYPIFNEDTLTVLVPPSLLGGNVIQMGLDTLTIGAVPALLSGTLAASINFISYTNQRDVLPDTLAVPSVPTLQSGTLVVTILEYTNQRDILPDTLGMTVPTLQSGTLVITINFIDYTYQRDVAPDSLQVASVPALLSGTLV